MRGTSQRPRRKTLGPDTVPNLGQNGPSHHPLFNLVQQHPGTRLKGLHEYRQELNATLDALQEELISQVLRFPNVKDAPTLAEVGKTLGMSKSRVHEKYGHLLPTERKRSGKKPRRKIIQPGGADRRANRRYKSLDAAARYTPFWFPPPALDWNELTDEDRQQKREQWERENPEWVAHLRGFWGRDATPNELQPGYDPGALYEGEDAE